TGLEIIISEKALNDYLAETYPELGALRITLQPELILINGILNILEARVEFQLAGIMEIKQEMILTFRPENLQVEDIQIPLSLLENYLDDLEFTYDLKELNLPLEAGEIVVSRGELRIYDGN
ncbi:MAG TPA: hypothetical protein VKY40_00325, partial [Halanaerobiales bacterium]|nr:hypothetical protein [Halanaerobiales bacterium]